MENIKYSSQARVMIKNLKNFDMQKFEQWFTEKLSVGSNNVLEYLIEKERQGGQKNGS